MGVCPFTGFPIISQNGQDGNYNLVTFSARGVLEKYDTSESVRKSFYASSETVLLRDTVRVLAQTVYDFTSFQVFGRTYPPQKAHYSGKNESGSDFLPLWEAPLNPQKYSCSFSTLKCCKFVHIRLNFQTFHWMSFQKTWKLVIPIHRAGNPCVSFPSGNL